MIALRRCAAKGIPPEIVARQSQPRQRAISVLVSCRNYTIQFLLVPYVIYSPGARERFLRDQAQKLAHLPTAAILIRPR